MRRKFVLVGLAGIGLLTGWIIWQASKSVAQPAGNKAGNAGNGPKAKAPDPLPIKRVVLFNSGVGYFQREGEIDGNTRFSLTFPAGEVNDLLKSMILEDRGGRVGTVNYDSHDPIDKILRSFALDLNNNPSYGQILNQARGEKIEVMRQEKKDGQPGKLQGTIIGMETQRQPVGKDQTVEVELLNLSTASGLQTIPLTQVLAVRFLNQTLETEFQRALQVLAQSHDTQKKAVSLGFSGAGKRKVKVGYVVERPIWKTTYRLRMDPNGKVFLQGWALVENTSDDDWNDVNMTLISGRPISFKMNLYEPLYIPRPTVEPELFASLRPPVYSGMLLPGEQPGQKQADDKGKDMGKQPPGLDPRFGGFGQLGSFQGGSFQGGFGGQMGMMGMGGMQMGMGGMMGQFGQFGQGGFNGNLGFQGGFNGNLGGFGNPMFNRYQNPNFNNDNFFLQNQQRLTFEELQQRQKDKQKAKDEAKKVLAASGLNFKEGIASVATAEEIGDYYQYAIDQKVTLPRQKSAMLPILDQTIEGHKVSIFNESVQSKYPLLGIRLKNTSGQPLTQGPITVYEDGSYAGDTRVLDLQPNEERLLSYALDQSTEVKTEVKTTISPEMTVQVGGDKLIAHFKYRETKTYVIKNRSPNDRKLVIEQPVRSEWNLVGGVKPLERARDYYRFQVAVPSGQVVKFEVPEEQKRVQQVALKAVDQGPARYFLDQGIEVVPVSQTILGDKMELKSVKNVLHARHKVRETRTYFVHNHSGQERTFEFEHLIRPGWTQIGGPPAKDEKNPKVYRFKMVVPAGKTLSREVVEEQLKVDQFKLSVYEDQPSRYVLALGVEVQPEVKTAPEQLVDLKIAKGHIQSRYKIRETTTYLVKNNLEKERQFHFEHLIRPDWKRLGEQDQPGPGIYRFEVKVGAGKTGSQDVVEEKTYPGKKQTLETIEETALKEYLASPAPSADVKSALSKTLALRGKLQEAKRKLADQEKQLQTVSDDQARLRANLQIIPRDAEPYKKFLQKFVDQETQIEELQRQIRQLQATVQNQQKEYDAFIAGATAE